MTMPAIAGTIVASLLCGAIALGLTLGCSGTSEPEPYRLPIINPPGEDPNAEWTVVTFSDHRYIKVTDSRSSNALAIVHDPDCPCHKEEGK